MQFELQRTSGRSKARAGRLTLTHGTVETPVFMPVGTHATVRTTSPLDMQALGAQIVLANTYNLFIRPGADVFKHFGGIHEFMQWHKPVLTDSGGFQVFSLSKHCKITEEGATFRSYTDGVFHLLSPEVSINMQESINSDIMMVLDHLVPATSSKNELHAAMELTHRWALRSLAARTSKNAMFSIVQGGTDMTLRRESANFLSAHPFDGFAIGGVACGEPKPLREAAIQCATEVLPTSKPRYLMGVGTPLDILEAVRLGVDMFDCILPTKHAQQGVAYTFGGRINVFRTAYRFTREPLEADCKCVACQTYSLGYLHHLIKCEEPIGWRLIALHNLTHYLKLMSMLRAAVLEDRFEEIYADLSVRLAVTDTKEE